MFEVQCKDSSTFNVWLVETNILFTSDNHYTMDICEVTAVITCIIFLTDATSYPADKIKDVNIYLMKSIVTDFKLF